jgi:hypothetical protein
MLKFSACSTDLLQLWSYYKIQIRFLSISLCTRSEIKEDHTQGLASNCIQPLKGRCVGKDRLRVSLWEASPL